MFNFLCFVGLLVENYSIVKFPFYKHVNPYMNYKWKWFYFKRLIF